MRANEFFYSWIIPFFNRVLEFYLVIVTIKIITAQNMTVKQETLTYQPYYDLAKNSITMLIVIQGGRLRFKIFWIFTWKIWWSVIEETSRPRKRLLFFLAVRVKHEELRWGHKKTSVRGNTEEKRSMCCSCRLGKVRSIISFPTHLKGENQMRVYSSFGVLLQAVI